MKFIYVHYNNKLIYNFIIKILCSYPCSYIGPFTYLLKYIRCTVIGANRCVRNAFPIGVGKRWHGQGGGRRDERMGVREAQYGQLFISERRR